MKSLYLFLLLIIAQFTIRGQNAFYDAKKLSGWMVLHDTVKQTKAAEYYAIVFSYDSARFRSSSNIELIRKDIVFHYNLKLVSDKNQGKLIFYISSYFGTPLRNLVSGDSLLYQKVAGYRNDSISLSHFLIDTATFFRLVSLNSTSATNLRNQLYHIDSLLEPYKPLLDKPYIDSLTSDTDSTSLQYRSYFKTDLAKIKTAYRNAIRLRTDDYHNVLMQDTLYVADAFQNLDIEIKKVIVPNADRALVTESERSRNQSRESLGKSQERLNIDKAEQTEAYVKTSISDQNFPSQSEIIDALAIYIARRFKQEIAYTFIEKFTRYLQNNILARELFPATFSLLNTQDPYTMPRLGSEWKNAVSADLIQLPEHVVSSSIVRKWIGNDSVVSYLSDAVLIGKYISKKYSYVDMVRSLKEKNGLNTEADTLKSVHLKQAVLVAHIMNQEFFDSSKTKFWITPEELFRLNKQQVQLLGELICEKYDTDFKSYFNGRNPLDTVRSYYTQFRSRYTDLLATLKQFENSQVGAYQAAKEGGNLKDAFWDFQRILIDYLLREVKSEKSRASIRNVQKLFYVYDYISAKNYGAAINTSLDMLDTLMLHKSPSHYLRAFVSDVMLTKIENMSLTADADTNIVYTLDTLEVLAKTVKSILKAGNYHTLMDSIKTSYQGLFKTDLPAFIVQVNDSLTNLGQSAFTTATVDSTVKVAVRLMEQYRVRLLSLANSKPELQELFKKLTFYTPENASDLQQYLVLAEQFLLNKSPNLVSGFRKVSGFLTDASIAKDSKELSKVLEAYAQPPLSFKLTRKSLSSIDLNAYLGGWVGTEFTFKTPPNDFSRFKLAAGFTVPVGISFSWGGRVQDFDKINKRIRKDKSDNRLFFMSKRGKHSFLTGVSHSFFISLIDIAGPVSFRLGDDTAKGLPQETRWSQLLAPGIHYVLGFKNSPLCLTAGFQVSPQLRSYQNIAGKPFTTGRVQVGLTYDMPLLNFRRKLPF